VVKRPRRGKPLTGQGTHISYSYPTGGDLRKGEGLGPGHLRDKSVLASYKAGAKAFQKRLSAFKNQRKKTIQGQARFIKEGGHKKKTAASEKGRHSPVWFAYEEDTVERQNQPDKKRIPKQKKGEKKRADW